MTKEDIVRVLEGAGVVRSVFMVLLVCVVITEAGTVPPDPPRACSTFTSCDSCLKNVSCLWCYTNNTCTDYPVAHLLPPSSVCSLSQARWGVCWVNFEALIIAMGVLAGVLLLIITVCCCCCCCRCGSSSRFNRFEEEIARRRERSKQLSEERRAERRMKHDEIRRKYGLMPDSDHPYSRFENE